MEVDNEDVPVCLSCGHRHVLGVRCAICGHVGKSQIFTKMRQKAGDGRSISIENLESPSYNATDDIHAKHNIVIELVAQLHRDYEGSEQNYTSNHVLCSVGDLPVATARWRLYQNDQTLWILQIDRLVTTNHNQRRGFAYRCLHKILAVAATFPTGFNCIEIIVPQIHESAWVLMKLQSLGFAVSDHVVPSWLGVAAHTATLHLGGIDAQRSELDRIQSFLLQKTAVLVR